MTIQLDTEYGELLQSIVEKSIRFLTETNQQQSQSIFAQEYMNLMLKIHQVMLSLSKNPEHLWKKQMAYWQDALSLSTTQLTSWLQGKNLPIEDRRFDGEEWENNPYFNFLTQQYLLISEHITALTEQMDYGDVSLKKRVQFFMQQCLDALYPLRILSKQTPKSLHRPYKVTVKIYYGGYRIL